MFRLSAILVFVVAMLFIGGTNNSQVSAAVPRPLVLLLPGGGFQHADPATMEPWVTDFTNHGIRSRAITYPLRDIPAAIAYVGKIADKERGPVIVYGISAGGTIAAALAATGRVDGAVNVVGPTDFTRWYGPAGTTIMRQIGLNTYAQRRAASPYWMLNGKQSPQLIQCGIVDPLVTFDQCVRYNSASRQGQRDTQFNGFINGHSQLLHDRTVAREWIASHWPSNSP